MALVTARFLTHWQPTDEQNDGQEPAICDIDGIRSWTQISGQPARNVPTDPNATVVEVTAEASVIDAIEKAGHALIHAEEIATDAEA